MKRKQNRERKKRLFLPKEKEMKNKKIDEKGKNANDDTGSHTK